MRRLISSSASRASNRWRGSKRQLARGLAPCRDLPGVVDVRVKGAIGVVELERIADLEALRRRFVAEGVWLRPFGRIVYLTPAFTIGEEELARLMAAILAVLRGD